MNRLEGKDAASNSGPSEAETKVKEEINKIHNMGSELMGIARSVETLMDLFNSKVNEYLGSRDCLIKLPADEYRSIFTADVQRLEDLIQGEVEQRKELQGQQAEFDNFIQSKIETFMEAKQEMENEFIKNYEKAWMQKEIALNNPDSAYTWEPNLEKMPCFGRQQKSYNFEWPTLYQVQQWNHDRKIELQRITTNWSSLRSIQLHLTGNISSTELAASQRGDFDRENMMNINIPPNQKRSVPITEIGIKMSSSLQFYGIKFTYATGDVFTLFEADGGLWKTKQIPKGKDIIGIYGNADEDRLYSLGFIVWEPNAQAV